MRCQRTLLTSTQNIDDHATQVRNLTDLGTKNPGASSVMIGKYSQYIDNAGDDHTYFDLGSLYNKNPGLSDEANEQFMKDQMSAGKPFDVELPPDTLPGDGLTKELNKLNSNPAYGGSLDDRHFAWVWW